MSEAFTCCPEDAKPSVRQLIHDLSAHWVDQGKPAENFVLDPDTGNSFRAVVTGVRVTARGQSLEYRITERDGEPSTP